MSVDRVRCVGAGQCTAVAPGMFDISAEDGLVVLLDPAPGPADHDAVAEAILLCPRYALEVLAR
ncbi:ferredoxin [Saccharothrix obliqua]|uniref:ferredoxin n=1 Tax=Saccharothrix obliqua TaxID=2861747 RepID=UPI0027E32C57|nr:ferredoxin [Saccharothrix obliqua]